MAQNNERILTFTSKLYDFEMVNSEFTKCKCYALASGDNANGTDITMDAIDKAIARGEFFNKPIIAHLFKDEDNGHWRIGGHDSKWVISNNGIEIIDECIPFGTIPESANIRKEEVLEPDGITVNTYVVMDIILWTGRYNIMDAAYSDDVYFNQSCEIYMNSSHEKDNGIVAIDDFTFQALCLLNKSDDKEKNHYPCFPSCRVEKFAKFSVDEGSFRRNFELMLQNLKKYETDNKSVQNTISTPTMKGEKHMDQTKIKNLLSDIKYGDDHVKYSFMGADNDNIYVFDNEENNLFSVGYAETDDSVVVNWDTKKEAEVTYAAKSDGKEKSVFAEGLRGFLMDCQKEYDVKLEAQVKSISDDAEARLVELRNDYSDLQNSYAAAKSKLDKFEAAEAEKEKREHIKAVNDILAKFEAKIGKTPEFVYYKAKLDCEKADIDSVEKDLTLMTGDILMNKKSNTKTFSYQPSECKITSFPADDGFSERYGNLLAGYMN